MGTAGADAWSDRACGGEELLGRQWGVRGSHGDRRGPPGTALLSHQAECRALPLCQGPQRSPRPRRTPKAPSPRQPRKAAPSTLVDLKRHSDRRSPQSSTRLTRAPNPTLPRVKTYSKTSRWESLSLCPRGTERLSTRGAWIPSSFVTEMPPILVIGPHKATW